MIATILLILCLLAKMYFEGRKIYKKAILFGIPISEIAAYIVIYLGIILLLYFGGYFDKFFI